MDITKTVFNVHGILSKIDEGSRPNKHEMYLFAKGGTSALSKDKLQLIEAIIERDYKNLKSFISQCKKNATS